jgi:hypothetical protein
MNDAFLAFAVIGTLTYGLVSIINSISSHRIKRRLLDKIPSTESLNQAFSDSVKALTEQSQRDKYPTLKWGLVFLGAGIGLIISEVVDYEFDSPMPYGVLLTCISLGFLIYYFLMKREEKNG